MAKRRFDVLLIIDIEATCWEGESIPAGEESEMFKKQCQQRQIPYPFGTRHLNIKTLFPLLFIYPREVGMAKALTLLEIPLEGTHHRGGDDAWNIAAIVSAILNRKRTPLQ